MGWSGHLAGWASVAVLPLVSGKKIAFTKSFSGGKHQCLRTHWFRILIFALGNR